jgi:hypothetical protein
VTGRSRWKAQARHGRGNGHDRALAARGFLITIPNQKLLQVLGGQTTARAFKRANEVLQGAVQGIAELITGRASSTWTSPTCAR